MKISQDLLDRSPRVLGALTVAYSAAILVRPVLMAKPCGFTTPGGSVSSGVAGLVRGVGARDAAIGLAMVLAPTGRALRTATLVRVASDLGDAVALGAAVSADRRVKVLTVALGWGLLNAATLARTSP